MPALEVSSVLDCGIWIVRLPGGVFTFSPSRLPKCNQRLQQLGDAVRRRGGRVSCYCRLIKGK
jgi:hypothetical protein